MTIEQEIENLISRDTRSRGGEILQLLSISRDDYGLGRSKENCLDIRRNESSIRSSHIDIDIDINIDNENQNKVQVTGIKCEKLKNKEKRKENTSQIDLEASNDKCNTGGVESKMIISPTSDITENWVRCLIVIRKLDGKKDKIITPKNPESSGSRSIISQEEDIVTCYPPGSKGVTKSISCLPNIFNNISDKQNEETSLEFDNFIFPGFRKNLFDATWRGGTESEFSVLAFIFIFSIVTESFLLLSFLYFYVLTLPSLPFPFFFLSSHSFRLYYFIPI